MTEACVRLSALGKRAVACAGFRWLPGMATSTGLRVADTYPAWLVDGALRLPTDNDTLVTALLRESSDNPPLRPDLTDPCTLGGMLSLVREAWGDVCAFAIPHQSGGWVVLGFGGRRTGAGVTEAEALVAALEAVPS